MPAQMGPLPWLCSQQALIILLFPLLSDLGVEKTSYSCWFPVPPYLLLIPFTLLCPCEKSFFIKFIFSWTLLNLPKANKIYPGISWSPRRILDNTCKRSAVPFNSDGVPALSQVRGFLSCSNCPRWGTWLGNHWRTSLLGATGHTMGLPVSGCSQGCRLLLCHHRVTFPSLSESLFWCLFSSAQNWREYLSFLLWPCHWTQLSSLLTEYLPFPGKYHPFADPLETSPMVSDTGLCKWTRSCKSFRMKRILWLSKSGSTGLKKR